MRALKNTITGSGLPVHIMINVLINLQERILSSDMNDLFSEHSEAKNVWEGYDDEDYRRDQSHWRGYGRWKNDNAWQAIGKSTKKNIELIYCYIGKRLNESEKLCFLEWGPGGGANIFGMRDYAYRYYGVDISEKNLSEANRMISEEGYAEIFKPIRVLSQPSDVLGELDVKIDVFVSTAVFQHFPSKAYGAEVLKVVSKIMAPNGVGVVQIRFDNGNPKFKPIEALSSYKKKHITANSYAIEEFWDLLKLSGFIPLCISNIRSENNYATYFFKNK